MSTVRRWGLIALVAWLGCGGASAPAAPPAAAAPSTAGPMTADLPPPLDPEASRAAIRVPPGFVVELVAAEPLVADPIAIAWGPDGRLWVVEMADYPLGGAATGGRVRCLTDDNGDGQFDRSTVFLDGLRYPTAALPWREGVLVISVPDVILAHDRNGDGRADDRRVLYSGMTIGNPQHVANGLRWGPDGWLHCANGQTPGKITNPSTGQAVQLGLRDFRLEPDSGRMEALYGHTQWVREPDDFGHWFGNSNSNPMYHFALDDVYFARAPWLPPPSGQVRVSETPGAAPVFPRSTTLARFNDLSAVNRFTSACSAIVYRDELLGPEFVGNAFVCEPVHNLVHRELLEPRGTTFISRRPPDEARSEFLASTDNWFRPAMVRTGPDGALWVVDMYRLVIEHPEWIPDAWEAQLDLRAGADRGRIYRVYHRDRPPRRVASLAGLDAPALVKALDHPSGTYRDLVAQQLLERADPRTAELLRAALAGQGTQPIGRPQVRFQMLATLAALDDRALQDAPPSTPALDDTTLDRALGDPHPGVRRLAVRLAESRLGRRPDVAARLASLADDPDPQVRLQVACSLGAVPSPPAAAALGRLAARDHADPFTVPAVLSSLGADTAGPAFVALVEAAGPAGPPPALAEQFASAAACVGAATPGAEFIARIGSAPGGEFANWQLAAGVALLEGLASPRTDAARRAAGVERSWNPLVERYGLGHLERAARAAVGDTRAAEPRRLLAVRWLARDPDTAPADRALLADLLGPSTPPAVRQAALDALLAGGDETGLAAALDCWADLSPELRLLLIDATLRRPAWAAALLGRLESGAIATRELDPLRARGLLDHRDGAIRERAAKALQASAASTDRAAVVARYAPAMTATGDAARGREVFAKSCGVCHQLAGQGHAVGPDLSAVLERPAGWWLDAILDPNRAVESKFVAYAAQTTDGLVYTGLVADETSTSVTLTWAEGKRATLPRQDLEALRATGKSLMPEGLEQTLDLPAVTDLLAYVASRRSPPKQFPGNEPRLVRPEALRGEFWLLADSAELHGSTIRFAADEQAALDWLSGDDRLAWTCEAPQPATFEFSVEYAGGGAGTRRTVLVALDDQDPLRATLAGGTHAGTLQSVPLGRVALSAGPHRVVLRFESGEAAGGAADPNGWRVRSVRLRPVR